MAGMQAELGRTRQLATSTRAVLVLVCAVLLTTGNGPHPLAVGLVLAGLVGVGLASTTVPVAGLSARLVTLLEAVLWATGTLLTGGDKGALLPYLLAPALAGGLALGLEGVALPVGVGAVAVLAGSPALGDDAARASLAAGAAEWLVLALLVGLLAAWVNRLSVPPDPGYFEAYQLLGQLRTLTRALPLGLDSSGLAEGLLRELQTDFPRLRSGAVYTRSPGNLPALRATSRRDRLNWRVDLSEDSVFTEAWSTQSPTSAAGPDASLLALPLVVANRTVGVIGLEVDPGDVPEAAALTELTRRLDLPALRLESAMLFDELRELATVEERRRLAREIHDGIAQDLAAFGYQLDGLARTARGGDQPDVADAILVVRAELGRLVSELRSSIFELRSEVDHHGGLGAALTEYVRGVGAASSLTVHLTLDETPQRLPSDTEAQLLRIAQEAVTNARKHASAQNLWVRCDVDPPYALLVVEDDGSGPGVKRDGRFGLEIMRERAERLRAEFDISARDPKGTVVTCRLGPRG